MEKLTSRERDVALLVKYGMNNKQIANTLGISEGTVKVHLHTVYKKMKLNGRLHLAVELFVRERIMDAYTSTA